MIAMMAGAGLTQVSPRAFAEGYPDRPVKVIVPFAPGGPTDIMARLIAMKLSETTGKQFYVDNQGGAGGNIGMGAAARSAPDGLTVLLAATSYCINPALYKKVPYDPLKDFAPITAVGDSPCALYVHPSVPCKNVKEFVDLVKANPGKYSYATGGVGTLVHLSTELLKLMFDLDLPHVPHRSAGPAVQSTLGGHVLVGCSSLPSVKDLMKEGQLRGLAVTSAKRFPSAPDIPTMLEQGISLESNNWQSFMVPAGTPKPVIDFLYTEIAKIMKSPGMSDRFIELGFAPIESTPDDVAKLVKSDLEKWGKVIKDAKIETL